MIEYHENMESLHFNMKFVRRTSQVNAYKQWWCFCIHAECTVWRFVTLLNAYVWYCNCVNGTPPFCTAVFNISSIILCTYRLFCITPCFVSYCVPYVVLILLNLFCRICCACIWFSDHAVSIYNHMTINSLSSIHSLFSQVHKRPLLQYINLYLINIVTVVHSTFSSHFQACPTMCLVVRISYIVLQSTCYWLFSHVFKMSHLARNF